MEGLRILFTGASTPSGGYIVAKLQEAGHKVYTLGKGDRFNLDFRFLGENDVVNALVQASSDLGGLPDVVIHNARLAVGKLSHVLHVNVTSRSLIDSGLLQAHERAKTDTSFRSIHILGWGPEWSLRTPEILASLAAQSALPTAFASNYHPELTARIEREHLRDLAKRDHDRQQEKQKLDHDTREERTRTWHEQREEEYRKKEFEPAPFRDKVEDVWVPKLDAVLINVDPVHRANGAYTRERLCDSALYALETEHVPGAVHVEIVRPGAV